MTTSPLRPLSPHLQVYHWYFTMFLSILHRASGVVLSAGTVAITLWLLSAASGAEAFATFHASAASLCGQVVTFGFVLAFSFHLLNGIRHLVWDCGYNIDKKGAYLSGLVTFAGAIVLTAIIWHLGGGI